VSKSESRFGAPGKSYERLPAPEIEAAVVAQIRTVLTSPESIASVVRHIQRNGGQVDEATTVMAMGRLNDVWDLTRRAHAVRERILRWTSIPTCIGLAPTKTLAKLCNHVAKDAERKPGSYPAELARVCNWNELTQAQRVDLLHRTPAGDVWGIGKKIGAKLAEQGIVTALDLAQMPAGKARDGWNVMLERTVRELQGVSCIPLEQAPAPKQQIACTRSFGHPITTLPP
jgi:DNA polymerase V